MISVRQMEERDLQEARRIFQVAFGTHIGLPEPATFAQDRNFVDARWRADPAKALAAEADGVFAGSNFLTRWGSFGFFGPLTIRPDLWGQRVAQALLRRTVEMFDGWKLRSSALYTFANSPKHIALYQKLGYWPQFLTGLMFQPVQEVTAAAVKYSGLAEHEREDAVRACRELTDGIYEGLDVGNEIRAVQDQRLGDTVLVWGGSRLEALAVCHCGAGSEAGTDNCYVKFAASREEAFDRMLDGVHALAFERGLHRIDAGVNTARTAAYRRMLERGFRAATFGIAMVRGESPGYNRPESFVLDDWR